jgi:hypothetical protein
MLLGKLYANANHYAMLSGACYWANAMPPAVSHKKQNVGKTNIIVIKSLLSSWANM